MLLAGPTRVDHLSSGLNCTSKALWAVSRAPGALISQLAGNFLHSGRSQALTALRVSKAWGGAALGKGDIKILWRQCDRTVTRLHQPLNGTSSVPVRTLCVSRPPSGLPLPTPSQFSGSDLDGPAPEDQPRGSIPGDDWDAGP